MPARDKMGAVRLIDTGNLPFTPELKNFHRGKLEDRAVQEKRPVSIQMVIDDVYAIGKGLAENIGNVKTFEFYEVHEFITNGVNGYISDSRDELKRYIEMLLADYELAKRIGDAGRRTAIDLFGREKIKSEWEQFFASLG